MLFFFCIITSGIKANSCKKPFLYSFLEIYSNQNHCWIAKCFLQSVGILTNVLWHVAMNLENYQRRGRVLLLKRVLCVNLALRHTPCWGHVKFSLKLRLTLLSADETEFVCKSALFKIGEVLEYEWRKMNPDRKSVV